MKRLTGTALVLFLAACSSGGTAVAPQAAVRHERTATPTSYHLRLNIDAAGLGWFFRTHNRVGLIGSATAIAPGDTMPVLWAVFAPRTQYPNEVSWVLNDVWLYASDSLPQPDATVYTLALVQSKPGWRYTLGKDRAFTGQPTGAGDAYTIVNKASTRTFGIGRGITVNGSTYLGYLNIRTIPFNLGAIFTPGNSVSLFPTLHTANVVFGSIPAGALTVTPTPDKPTLDIGFDDKTKTFFLKE